jgi:5-bromo-4-chloroindolyl phosphate hydrolysis protein
MALKTFNLDKEVYEEFSKHCKENGISMSKKVEKFIREELEMLKVQTLGKEVKKAKEMQKFSEVKNKVEVSEPSFGKYC